MHLPSLSDEPAESLPVSSHAAQRGNDPTESRLPYVVLPASSATSTLVHGCSATRAPALRDSRRGNVESSRKIACTGGDDVPCDEWL